jgi:hypothetical protein
MLPSEELDTQVPDGQCGLGFQLLPPLLPAKRGWFTNHALQPTPIYAGLFRFGFGLAGVTVGVAR